MRGSKYISFSDGILQHAIVFDATFTHSDVWKNYKAMGYELLGAGFVSVSCTRDYDIIIKAYGESLSLGVRSREEDSRLLYTTLGF